jgi:hypothetical protein
MICKGSVGKRVSLNTAIFRTRTRARRRNGVARLRYAGETAGPEGPFLSPHFGTTKSHALTRTSENSHRRGHRGRSIAVFLLFMTKSRAFVPAG